MKEVLAISGGFLAFAGMFLYAISIRGQSKTKPNLTVLIALSGIAFLNAISYLHIVQGDLYKSINLLIGLVSQVIILYLTIKSKNYLFKKRDIGILIGGGVLVCIMFVLLPTVSNHIIMQISLTIPYIPLIIGIVTKEGHEPFAPWFVILLSSLCGLGAVLVDYSDFWSLIHPVRNILIQIIILVCIKVYKPSFGFLKGGFFISISITEE